MIFNQSFTVFPSESKCCQLESIECLYIFNSSTFIKLLTDYTSMQHSNVLTKIYLRLHVHKWHIKSEVLFSIPCDGFLTGVTSRQEGVVHFSSKSSQVGHHPLFYLCQLCLENLSSQIKEVNVKTCMPWKMS